MHKRYSWLTNTMPTIASSGFFRPNRLAMYPKNMLPTKPTSKINSNKYTIQINGKEKWNIPPTQKSAAIQLAWSIVIGPDGNGVLSDVSNSMLSAIHPKLMPSQTVNRFTISWKRKTDSMIRFLFPWFRSFC